MKEIADSFGFTAPAAYEKLRALERKGYIERKPQSHGVSRYLNREVKNEMNLIESLQKQENRLFMRLNVSARSKTR